jgi:hypothetical protein
LLHLHRLLALLDFHCRTVGLLDHIVKVENLIQNLAVYLLFSLYLFRSSVSHFEVEVRIDLSVGADQQRWAYLLWILFLLDFVETNHHVVPRVFIFTYTKWRMNCWLPDWKQWYWKMEVVRLKM